MLEEAFAALKQYDWGTDHTVVNPIEDAVAAAHKDAAVQKDLETRLIAALKSDISRDAKDYVGRKLTIVGTAAAVPALAALLGDKDHSHMVRYALERIPAAEAAQALRDALPKMSGAIKIGIIGSLGVRRDAASVAPLAGLLKDSDPGVARAAAIALGDIGNAEAAKVLADAKPEATAARQAVTDARLATAEALLAAGKKVDALAIYKTVAAGDQPKHVRLAATRGMLACAGK